MSLTEAPSSIYLAWTFRTYSFASKEPRPLLSLYSVTIWLSVSFQAAESSPGYTKTELVLFLFLPRDHETFTLISFVSRTRSSILSIVKSNRNRTGCLAVAIRCILFWSFFNMFAPFVLLRFDSRTGGPPTTSINKNAEFPQPARVHSRTGFRSLQAFPLRVSNHRATQFIRTRRRKPPSAGPPNAWVSGWMLQLPA